MWQQQTPPMENLNTPQELDRLKSMVMRQLQMLQGAPSVQMMEVIESLSRGSESFVVWSLTNSLAPLALLGIIVGMTV